MRKTIRYSVAVLIVSVTLSVSSGCSKDGEECRLCKSRNADGELMAEQQVCSDQEEQAFRAQQEGRSVTCQ